MSDIIWEIYSSASPSWEISNNFERLLLSSAPSSPWEISDIIWENSDNLGKTFPSSASWERERFLTKLERFLLVDRFLTIWFGGRSPSSCKYYVDVFIGGWDVLDSEERGQISHRRLCSWVLWPCKRGSCQNHFGERFDSHFWETLRQQGVRNFWRGLHRPRGWSEESIWLCFSIHLFCHLCFAHVHNQQLRRIPLRPRSPPPSPPKKRKQKTFRKTKI